MEFYSGAVCVIIDSTDKKLHLGKLHPIKIGKLIYELVKGVTKIKPIGFIGCHGFMSSILSTRIYSYSVMRLEECISEIEFFKGLDSI